MSDTHHNGQKLSNCPECGRSVRLKPDRMRSTSPVVCGRCGTEWDPFEGDNDG